MSKCHGEFVAFRVLYEAIPMSEQTCDLICRCLEYYLTHSGKSISVVERFLAQYKIELCETEELKWREKTK